jgi:NAD(P)-dependent dehydrogenase (short-subunit alcohol dehydrogenase family)
MELKGIGALVTGASSGLGEALSRQLARSGARVAMVARGEARLMAAVERLRAEGGDVHAIPGDVGLKEDIHRIAGAAAALVGPVSLLVNNASALGPVPLELLLDTECEELERALAVNLVGPFRLSKLVIGPMALKGSGLVVNITSDASVGAYERWGAYGASKAALDHLTRIWGVELNATGVKLLAVDPGEMDTPMHAEAMPDADRSALPSASAAAEGLISVIRQAEQWPSGTRIELAKEAPR